MTHRKGLMWFREDLRVQDNTALTSACNECNQVLAFYIIDRHMWQQHNMALCRIDFIFRNLLVLQSALLKKNILFLIIEIKSHQQLIPVIEDLISFYKMTALYFNEQYELNEARRDARIKTELKIPVNIYTDQVIFQPQQLLTLNKTPYTIYTPYKKRFLQEASTFIHIAPLAAISACASLLPKFNLPLHWIENGIIVHDMLENELSDAVSATLKNYWPAGEIAAQRRLRQFINEKIYDYHLYRDMPSQKATSKLSAYLSNGLLSSRQCFLAAINANHGKLQNGFPGIDLWINELIWREFYKQILANFPKVSMHQAFKTATEAWPWRHDMKLFTAWTKGKTGYPLIDAAMRQLKQTGWMHNRLRMVVAMFLTKDCFIDWRLGEKYFMQHLIDGDLAANNGGWQWAASTGCDAVPYFRIFNPVRQSERFDSEGLFIKTYCPELIDVPSKRIHNPFTLPEGLNYPAPIIDYRNTRHLLQKNIKGSSLLS